MQGTGAEREMGQSTDTRDGEVKGMRRRDNFCHFWKRREGEGWRRNEWRRYSCRKEEIQIGMVGLQSQVA
jgi:hypothetical protein